MLVLIGGLLLRKTFRPQLQVLAIWHPVIMNMPEHDLDSAVRHIVQEFPVVRNQQERSLPVPEIILKPLDRLYVQMIGRLIQHQEIGLGKQNLRKLDPHVPALAEGVGKSVEILIPESQAEEGLLGKHLGRFALADGHYIGQIVQTGYERQIFL